MLDHSTVYYCFIFSDIQRIFKPSIQGNAGCQFEPFRGTCGSLHTCKCVFYSACLFGKCIHTVVKSSKYVVHKLAGISNEFLLLFPPIG